MGIVVLISTSTRRLSLAICNDCELSSSCCSMLFSCSVSAVNCSFCFTSSSLSFLALHSSFSSSVFDSLSMVFWRTCISTFKDSEKNDFGRERSEVTYCVYGSLFLLMTPLDHLPSAINLFFERCNCSLVLL